MRVIKYPDEMPTRSKFRFIAVASQRCRQLQKGAKPRVHSRSRKFTTVAQEEVLAGKIEFSELPLDAAAPAGEGAGGGLAAE